MGRLFVLGGGIHFGATARHLMTDGSALRLGVSFLAIIGSFDDIFDQSRLSVLLFFDGNALFWDVEYEVSIDCHII